MTLRTVAGEHLEVVAGAGASGSPPARRCGCVLDDGAEDLRAPAGSARARGTPWALLLLDDEGSPRWRCAAWASAGDAPGPELAPAGRARAAGRRPPRRARASRWTPLLGRGEDEEAARRHRRRRAAAPRPRSRGRVGVAAGVGEERQRARRLGAPGSISRAVSRWACAAWRIALSGVEVGQVHERRLLLAGRPAGHHLVEELARRLGVPVQAVGDGQVVERVHPLRVAANAATRTPRARGRAAPTRSSALPGPDGTDEHAPPRGVPAGASGRLLATAAPPARASAGSSDDPGGTR